MMMTISQARAAIRIDRLTKRFRGQTAVDGLSLEVPEGSVFGLLGENGAGKTTTIQTLLGDHQDSIVAADFLREEGVRVGLRSGHNGFTYGLLYGHERARRAAITEQLRPFLS